MMNKDLGFESENILRVKMFQRVPFTVDMEEYKEEGRSGTEKELRVCT